MVATSPSASQYRTFTPVPKPKRRRVRAVAAQGHAARRLAEVQGYAFTAVAADLDAADANDTADVLDTRRDPLTVEMVRLFRAIRHDLSTSAASRALASRGEAIGLESIRIDAMHDEHRRRGRKQIGVSLEADQACAGGIDTLLTGREAP